MKRLNGWVCTLLTAFFCFAFVPSYALAADETLGGPKVKTEALASSDAQLNAELADINARIDELEAVIAKAEAQVAVAQKAEVAKMNARIDAINSEIAKLVVQVASDEEILARMETFLGIEMDASTLNEQETLEQPAQDFAYLKLADEVGVLYEEIDAWVEARGHIEADVAKASAQIAADNSLQGPHTKAQIPSDVETPVVTAHEQALANKVTGLKQDVTRLQTQKNGALLAVFTLLATLFFVLMALARKHQAMSRIVHEKDIEIAKLKRGFDEVLGVAVKVCQPEEVVRARVLGTPAAPSSDDKTDPRV